MKPDDGEIVALWHEARAAYVAADAAGSQSEMEQMSGRAFSLFRRIAESPCQGVPGVLVKLRLMQLIHDSGSVASWEDDALLTSVAALENVSGVRL